MPNLHHKLTSFILSTLMITFISCQERADLSVGQQDAATSPPAVQTTQQNQTLAAEGDSVWVIINHVKADKRQQFEQFVHEFFWPSSQQLSPEEQRPFTQTRILHPAGPEPDGTYSYIFIMDPLVEKANYDIEAYLGKMYPKDKADEYSRMLGESMAREQTQYRVVQARRY